MDGMGISRLMREFRRWWYNNELGPFDLDNGGVSRLDAYWYGGPSPDFNDCEICQRSEWYSRIEQRFAYKSHTCKTAAECLDRCQKQGDDAWTNWHQDHYFAIGVDDALNAPKAALMLKEGASQYKWYWTRNCNDGQAAFRQRLAWTGTADTDARLVGTDWSKYDWAWMVNKGQIAIEDRPDVPLVMYCHDAWRGNKQEALDHYQPDVVLTPFPTLWRTHLRVPDASEVVFTPPAPSPFFTRPNLDDTCKTCDLLVIGALNSDFYIPRREWNARLEALPSRFKVQHSHKVGSKRAHWFGPLDMNDHCYMNKWNERLGQARFVTFGPCGGAASEMLLIKYYECLASGAIPIMPEVQDMAYIGVKPMVHYIPLSIVWDNIKALEFFLDNYDYYYYIAENAVAHYQEHAFEWTCGMFEDVVHRVTGGKYPKRLEVDYGRRLGSTITA